MPHPCEPRLFVHSLPEAYRDPLDTLGRGVGRPLAPPLDGVFVRLYDSDMYGLGALVHERSLQYNCRTHDPSTADLFFVPTFSARDTGGRCAEENRTSHRFAGGLARLRLPLTGSNQSVLEARGGADHVVLNARTARHWEQEPACELSLADSAFGSPIKLSAEAPEQGRGGWVYPEAPYLPRLMPEGGYHSIPWTSTVHLDLDSTRPFPWEARHERPILVIASFAITRWPAVQFPRPIHELRVALWNTCKAQQNLTRCTCASPQGSSSLQSQRLLPNGAIDPASTEATRRPTPMRRIAQLYSRATFCLQPGGDTVSRKAIVDALLLGCIPVLFHQGQQALWPWHWGSWVDNATVLLDQEAVRSGKLDAIGTLAALDDAHVRAMQLTIATHGHRMQYSALDTAVLRHHGVLGDAQAEDAFDLALQGALVLSRNAKRQSYGLARQQHARKRRGQVG